MTPIAWSPYVNSKFYAYNDKPVDNVVMSEFISGRKTGHQINTKAVREINCSIRLDIHGGELESFWQWYNYELGQMAGQFTCSALGDKVYRFTQTPEPQDTDLNTRELKLSIEEVY